MNLRIEASAQLLRRAAHIRRHALQLGNRSDYYVASTGTASSSSLVATAPETTNTFTLAYGEREGLAAGERLDMYGSRVHLVRALAYGWPRFPDGADGGAAREPSPPPPAYCGEAELEAMTRELNAITTQQEAEDRKSGKNTTERTLWRLAAAPPPPFENARRASPRRLQYSNDECVVAVWTRDQAADGEQPQQPHQKGRRCGSPDDASDMGTLIVENGVLFSRPELSGRRELRSARLAFMSCVERAAAVMTANDDGGVPLRVLDVNEIDFTFSHAALQTTLELGLRADTRGNAGGRGSRSCQLNYVPLTDAAAAVPLAEEKAATFVMQTVLRPGKAHPNPFSLLPAYHYHVGSYTALLDLPLPSGRVFNSKRVQQRGGGGGPNGTAADGRGFSLTASSPATQSQADNRSAVAVPLSRALATLRKGACMLVNFVPTPASGAALHRELSTQRRAEVLCEAALVREAKAALAEAISRTGRWGYITDEVLPAVDSPQGSAVSLLVVLFD